MKKADSLRRRISVAYLLFAFVVSLFFAVIAAVAVEGIEVRLVDERLEEVAQWAGPRYAGHLPVEMPAGPQLPSSAKAFRSSLRATLGRVFTR
jgi:hypothetical protein